MTAASGFDAFASSVFVDLLQFATARQATATRTNVRFILPPFSRDPCKPGACRGRLQMGSGYRHAAPVIFRVLERDLDPVARPALPSLGPLDRDDAVAGDEILEAEVGDLGGFETIEIDVIQ